ncbi:hypothetical protein DFS34DRAFT_403897 [Phlyctochytrium arcticum]|nr:hypothetical protein DFS34DRAFT_403897 [Phlyctochytrium arcticum]
MARIKLPRRILRDTSTGSSVSFATIQSVSSDIGTVSVKSESTQEVSLAIPASTSTHPPSSSKKTSNSHNSVSEMNGFERSDDEDDGPERADDEGGGMEEISSEAEPHHENLEDEQDPEPNKHLRRSRKSRSPNLASSTLEKYASYRRRFIAWCTEQNFSDGCWVRGEKIIAFCQKDLIAKGRLRGRKAGPPTPYSYSGVRLYITAFMHLYHEQVREGLHNYTNPFSCPRLRAFLKSLKRQRAGSRLNPSGNRGRSTPVDERAQNTMDSIIDKSGRNVASSAEGLQDPQIVSVAGMSELTNTMKALYNSTMERINGIENTISSLKTSTARSNDGIEHNSTSSEVSPPTDAADNVQDLITLFDTWWKEMENNSGRCHQQIKEIGQVTRRAILSLGHSESSTNN